MLFILFLSFPLIANTEEFLNRVTEKISEIEQFEKKIDDTIVLLNLTVGRAALSFLKKNHLLINNIDLSTLLNTDKTILDAPTIFSLIDKEKFKKYCVENNMKVEEVIALFKTLHNYNKIDANIVHLLRKIHKEEKIAEIKKETEKITTSDMKKIIVEANKKGAKIKNQVKEILAGQENDLEKRINDRGRNKEKKSDQSKKKEL